MKLSFIVPVYNVKPYLRKCVDSLLAQDYSDYEIILVDDGSTDNSGAICDEYASASFASFHHSIIPIRVIHQPNGGLSSARNAGLKMAKGDYVCFVDSDDYWEENVLCGLMTQIEREKLDVLRFDYQNVKIVGNDDSGGCYEVFEPNKRDHRLDNNYSEKVTDGVTFLNTRMSTACYAVMFILRRDLFIGNQTLNIKHQTFKKDSCLFTEGIFFEDTDWTPRMLVRAKRVASTEMVVYNYLVREGSITNAVNKRKQKKVLEDKVRLIGALQQQAEELRKNGLSSIWFSRMIADTVISIIGILGVDFYEERKVYLEKLKKMNVYPIVNKSIKARLINLSPKMAVMLLHLKNAK